MSRFLKILLTGACLTAAACGVKKSPDIYYHHPMQFDDGAPSPTPTPGLGVYRE